jgi:hypothetical protein
VGLVPSASVNLQRTTRNVSQVPVSICHSEQQKAAYQSELADIKAQESQYKNNLEAKLALAQQYAANIAQAEGADSSKAKQGRTLASFSRTHPSCMATGAWRGRISLVAAIEETGKGLQAFDAQKKKPI